MNGFQLCCTLDSSTEFLKVPVPEPHLRPVKLISLGGGGQDISKVPQMILMSARVEKY